MVEKEIHKIKLQKLNHGITKDTYVGVIDFSVLEKISKLTLREVSGGGKSLYYQRPEQKNKINRIVKFLEKNLLDDNEKLKSIEKVLSLFPTTMLLSFDSNDNSHTDTIIKIKDDELIIYENVGDFSEGNKPVLIVDGQHRFKGVKVFYDKHPGLLQKFDMQFPITILAGYDIYEQAEIFANVNFRQKKVDTSLFYDIFGADPNKKNDITFAHFLVSHLNSDEDSPLKGMIKMLSNCEGVVSQSAFVTEILKLLNIKNNKVFAKNFENYKIGKEGEKKVLESIKVYFEIIKETFPEYWPDIKNLKEYQGVLMKTTGARAFIKLMNEVLLGKVDLERIQKKKEIKEIFSKILEEDKKSIFDPQEGDFSGSGGLQNKLYHRLAKILGYE